MHTTASQRRPRDPLVADEETGQEDLAALRLRIDRLQRQFDAVDRASQIEAVTSGDVGAAAREIVELASATTGCARVNAWLFNDDETELHCIAAFEASTQRHSSGALLREPDFRAEFQALKGARYVDADDPLTDPRTRGYAESYLKPLRIASMLDAVVRVAGRPLGLLCFEHVERPHHWEQDEISFACQLADKLGLAIMTERRLLSEEQLAESEAALEEARALASVGSWNLDLESGRVTCSRETFRIFGVDPADFTPTYGALVERIHPDDREAVAANLREAIEDHGVHELDYRLVMEDGCVKHVHSRGQTVYEPDGRPVRSIGTVQDITARKLTEERLQLANTLLTAVMETSLDAVLVVDMNDRVIAVNQRFADAMRMPAAQLEGADANETLVASAPRMKDPEGFVARVRQLQALQQDGRDELEMADGRTVDRHTRFLHTAAGECLGRAWFFRDITERKLEESRMRREARHDALTGLANRAAFVEAVQAAIDRNTRGDRPFAVLYLDLDHFKDVNDSLGHPVGDTLLRRVGERLQEHVRSTDRVARFGGDEFAVIVSSVGDPMDAAAVASTLIAALDEPFWIDGNEIRTAASVGVSVYPGNEAGPEVLLSQADMALYRAKADGRGTFRFFTDEMDADVKGRVRTRAELRQAIELGQLFLVYHPQVHILSGRVTGIEALVRWRHPTRGVLEPAAFIPLAEESGLIQLLSQWVLREACRQARQWLDAGLTVGRIGVNLSAALFRAAPDLERQVDALLRETGFPPERLELELTESVLMIASREPRDVLARLRARRITLALDDFGTGYSSLDYLRRFPVDRLKIARPFVSQILRDGSSAAIVKATLGLARELGIAVIAEGVESQEQLDLLVGWGCPEAQGFHYTVPLAPEAIETFLRRGGMLREPALDAQRYRLAFSTPREEGARWPDRTET